MKKGKEWHWINDPRKMRNLNIKIWYLNESKTVTVGVHVTVGETGHVVSDVNPVHIILVSVSILSQVLTVHTICVKSNVVFGDNVEH